MKIGDKIVCIDDRGWTNECGEALVYRNVYVLKDITKCENCNKVYFDIGCRMDDDENHSSCCGRSMVGAGIDWVESKKFVPHIVTFKKFCRSEVVDKMQEDITSLIKNKEYEKAIEVIKRMEKIVNEL